jgi:hypothetical protein
MPLRAVLRTPYNEWNMTHMVDRRFYYSFNIAHMRGVMVVGRATNDVGLSMNPEQRKCNHVITFNEVEVTKTSSVATHRTKKEGYR